MEVLTPSGVPRTNGEVYAMVRRRRDERTAKDLPAFALQQQLVSGYPLLQQNFFQQKQQMMQNKAKNSDGQGSTGQSPGTAMVTSAPPLTVLLTEVLVLQYLTHHADLSSSALRVLPIPTAAAADSDALGERSPTSSSSTIAPWKSLPVVYGPGSMYDPPRQHHGTPETLPNGLMALAPRSLGEKKPAGPPAIKKEKMVAEGVGEGKKRVGTPSKIHDALWTAQDKVALAAARETTFAERPQMYAALVSHWYNRLLALPCPSSQAMELQGSRAIGDGTWTGSARRERERCHVQAVDVLLYLYETHGRYLEKEWAAAIRRLVQKVYRSQVRRLFSAAAAAPNGSVSYHKAGVSPLYFLGPPTSLQTIAEGIQGMSPVASALSEDEAAAIAAARVPRPPEFLFTEMDVIQLINARPQRELEAYRVLDDFSNKWEKWLQCIQDGHYPSSTEFLNQGSETIEDTLEGQVPQDVDSFMAALVEIFRKPILMDL